VCVCVCVCVCKGILSEGPATVAARRRLPSFRWFGYRLRRLVAKTEGSK